VFHGAFRNFEQRFGIEAVGAISDSDAVPPRPKRIALVRDFVAAQNVQCDLAGPRSLVMFQLLKLMRQAQISTLVQTYMKACCVR